MYGKETNPIVKYYDTTFALSNQEEIDFFINKATKVNSKILDLAGGTGRLTVELAKAGHNVTCLDQSEGMIAKLNGKIRSLPNDTACRIKTVLGDMSSFNFEEKFDLIICADAFFHNLTSDEQLNCLNSVSKSLAKDGRFVFNIPRATAGFINSCINNKEYQKRGEYKLENGDKLLIERAPEVDEWNQQIRENMRFKRFSGDGNLIDTDEDLWTTKYSWRHELEHLFKLSNFKVISCVGDFQGASPTDNYQLIYELSPLSDKKMEKEFIDVEAIDHTCLSVVSLSKSKQYFEKLFGAKCWYREGDSSTLVVETDSTHFFLTKADEGEVLTKQHISFRVNSLDDVIKKLDGFGVEDYETGSTDFFSYSNYKWCEWRAPDGIRLECIELLEEIVDDKSK